MSRNLSELAETVSRLKNFLGEEELLAVVFVVLLLLKENGARYRQERLPLETLKRDISRLPKLPFASEEASRCAQELYTYQKNAGQSDRILADSITETLLETLYACARTEPIPVLAEHTALCLSQMLPLLRQRILPSALTELMSALCGPLPKSAAVWDPYCGVGMLLSHTAQAYGALGCGMESNRLAAGFARVYYYLLTGRALALSDPARLFCGEPGCSYDAAVSVIPAGPPAAEERWDQCPFRPAARYGEAARIWGICDRLKEGGIAVLLAPNGILFREGSDLELRKMLLGNGWLDTVIYLPARVLFHTAVPSSILIIRKGARREGLRLLRLEENPGWLRSGRRNRLTDRAVREIPALLREEAPSAAGLRLVTPAEYEPANYRLDPQFYFGSRPAPEAGEQTREALRAELEQAERDYRQAREELAALIQTVLP